MINLHILQKRLKENWQIVALVIGTIFFLILLYFIITHTKTIKNPFSSQPTPAIKHYQTLDEALNKVINAPNPAAQAKEQKLAIENKGVKVLITLNDDSFFFTNNYGTQNFRYGKNIQAILLFDKIEELAQNKKVKSITSVKTQIVIPSNIKHYTPPKPPKRS